MLQRTEQARGLPYDNGVAPRHFDLVDLYAFLKSNRRVLAGWVIVALTVALVYAFTATPLYTATADLTIDSKKIQLFKNNEQVVGDNAMDSSQVESEVEVLGSESIALAVIDDLKLANDPEFVGTGNGPIVGLLSAIFGMDEDARSLSDTSAQTNCNKSLPQQSQRTARRCNLRTGNFVPLTGSCEGSANRQRSRRCLHQ